MLVPLLLLGLFALLWWIGSKKPSGYPPGPKRLPVFGYAFSVDPEKSHRTWESLGRRYGDVVGLFLGSTRMVLVNGWAACNEALTNPHLQGRPPLTINIDLFGGDRGIMFTQGQFWTTQRRFTLHHLRNLGLGKTVHHDLIVDEVKELIHELGDKKGPFEIQPEIAVAGITVLWAVLGGERLSHSDKKLHELVQLLYTLFRTGQVSGGLLNIFPWLRHICPDWVGFSTQAKTFKDVNEFLAKAIEDHKKAKDDDNKNSFLGIYLNEMRKPDCDPTFTESQLIALSNDLFTAGAETTSSLVGFCVLFLCLYPDWQAAIQKELDEHLKSTGQYLPTIEDKPKLVKTTAFLMEIMRFRDVAPLSIPHVCTQDTLLQGHRIPKETMVFINLRSIMMDQSYWGDPHVFRPERFIDSDGSIKKEERLIIFGRGKRACAGEALARMTSFLFFAGLTSHLSFSLPPHDPVPDTEGVTGFTLGPPPFRVVVNRRTSSMR